MQEGVPRRQTGGDLFEVAAFTGFENVALFAHGAGLLPPRRFDESRTMPRKNGRCSADDQTVIKATGRRTGLRLAEKHTLVQRVTCETGVHSNSQRSNSRSSQSEETPAGNCASAAFLTFNHGFTHATVGIHSFSSYVPTSPISSAG
ncbi:unnamed protein product [Soboliphyme baturini]|uniref:Uncharacterized protein n=1 Tax=Soboliphyme baturini TaxID=241478 RepID=A0A183INY0_9BILA|nr:unnamed protein product [Soboliphyme baturini]